MKLGRAFARPSFFFGIVLGLPESKKLLWLEGRFMRTRTDIVGCFLGASFLKDTQGRR